MFLCYSLWCRHFIHCLVMVIKIKMRSEWTCRERNWFFLHVSSAYGIIRGGGIIAAWVVKAWKIHKLWIEPLIYYGLEVDRVVMVVNTRHRKLARVLKMWNEGGRVVRPLWVEEVKGYVWKLIGLLLRLCLSYSSHPYLPFFLLNCYSVLECDNTSPE